MPIEELIYDSDEGTFVMMVDSEAFGKYKDGDSSIPIAEIVNSFDIFRYEQGHTGEKSTPSNRELSDVFGSSNDMAVAEFMVKNGSLHSKGKPQHKAKEAETDPRGHMA